MRTVFSILAILLAFNTTQSLAKESVKLEMDLTVDVDCITPIVTMNYGESAELFQEIEDGVGYAISIVPTKLPQKSEDALEVVELDMKIYRSENGKKTLLTAPRITTVFGEKATIEQVSDEQVLSLSILPTEI